MARGALSGIYNGRLYQKQDVRNSDTPYNYFLFDISSGCRFFANRVTYKCPDVGESLYDIMSDESIDELITHLTSFSEAPMFVLTKLGVAIVLPHLVPCSSFGILVLPHFDGSYLYRIFKHKKWDAVYSKEVDALPSSYSSNSKRYTADAELLYDRIHAAFDRVVGNPALLLRDNITAHLEERVYALSYFAGCPVGMLCNEPIEVFGDFDFPLFVAFILVMLTLAAEVTPKNEISVSLAKRDNEVEVRVDFVSNGRPLNEHTAIRMLKSLMDKKLLCFVPFGYAHIIHYKFYPTVKDWSLLGIKSPE